MPADLDICCVFNNIHLGQVVSDAGIAFPEDSGFLKLIKKFCMIKPTLKFSIFKIYYI